MRQWRLDLGRAATYLELERFRRRCVVRCYVESPVATLLLRGALEVLHVQQRELLDRGRRLDC